MLPSVERAPFCLLCTAAVLNACAPAHPSPGRSASWMSLCLGTATWRGQTMRALPHLRASSGRSSRRLQQRRRQAGRGWVQGLCHRAATPSQEHPLQQRREQRGRRVGGHPPPLPGLPAMGSCLARQRSPRPGHRHQPRHRQQPRHSQWRMTCSAWAAAAAAPKRHRQPLRQRHPRQQRRQQLTTTCWALAAGRHQRRLPAQPTSRTCSLCPLQSPGQQQRQRRGPRPLPQRHAPAAAGGRGWTA